MKYNSLFKTKITTTLLKPNKINPLENFESYTTTVSILKL